MQVHPLITAVTALGCLCYSASAEETDSSLPFLQPGSDYVLKFAGESPFTRTQSIPIDPPKPGEEDAARITSASITYSVSVFTVVETYRDTWVLVEHPKSIKDAFKWNFKRFAIAALNPKTIARLEDSDAGIDHLKRLRRQAATKIQTARTWVNMGHIVAITRPPLEPQDFELDMTVQSPD